MTKEKLKSLLVEISKQASSEAKEKELTKEETKKYIADAIEKAKKDNPITEETEKNEKKIKIHIPIDNLNPNDKEIIVGINEKYAKIVRGEDTEVSEPVYEQLRNAGLV